MSAVNYFDFVPSLPFPGSASVSLVIDVVQLLAVLS